MDSPTPLESHVPADQVDLLRRLDADAIRERLAVMERERHALLILLRVARATGRAGDRRAVSGD